MNIKKTVSAGIFILLFTIACRKEPLPNPPWSYIKGTSALANGVFATNGSTIVMGWSGADGNGALYLSLDNGNTWNMVNSRVKVFGLAMLGSTIFINNDRLLLKSGTDGITAVEDSLDGVTGLAVSGGNIYAGRQGLGVFVSGDIGVHWTAVNNGLRDLNIYQLQASGNNLYAVTDSGLFISNNAGSNWVLVNAQLAGEFPMGGIAVSDSVIYVGTNLGGVFVSSDNGATWQNMNNGLNTESSKDIHSVVSSGIKAYIATDDGVFYSDNNGANWSSLNLKKPAVGNLIISGNYVFATTDWGIWKTML